MRGSAPGHGCEGERRGLILKQRIYIAEDDGGIRELIRCTLESFGFDAFEFPDGEALLNQIQREGTVPDLVILDIMMPVKDGLETLKELREHGLTARDVYKRQGQRRPPRPRRQCGRADRRGRGRGAPAPYRQSPAAGCGCSR